MGDNEPHCLAQHILPKAWASGTPPSRSGVGPGSFEQTASYLRLVAKKLRDKLESTLLFLECLPEGLFPVADGRLDFDP